MKLCSESKKKKKKKMGIQGKQNRAEGKKWFNTYRKVGQVFNVWTCICVCIRFQGRVRGNEHSLSGFSEMLFAFKRVPLGQEGRERQTVTRCTRT